jgi:hypothetical protein
MPIHISGTHRMAWKSASSQIKSCDTLFWLQLGARPATGLHLVSLNRLNARLANFVIDAWKAYADPDRIGGDDRKSQSMLRRLSGSYNRAEAAVSLADSSGCRCRGDGCFYPRKEAKPNFAFNMVRRHKPLHQTILKIAKRVVSSICIPIGFCGETNPGGQLQARGISSLHHARSSTPKTTRVQSGWPDPNRHTQGVGPQERYVDNLIEAIVRMMGTHRR